jgi:hypothetical protein
MLVIAFLVLIVLSCSLQDKTIRIRNAITNIGRTRKDNQDRKYNQQHRQRKTRQVGQEIQSPTQAEQDKAIRTRNTISLFIYFVLKIKKKTNNNSMVNAYEFNMLIVFK